MDQPTRERIPDVVMTPETRWARPKKRSPWPALLATFSLFVAGGSLGYAWWSASESNREILRLSTELAQVRVSLDLYAQNRAAAAGDDSPTVANLTDRIDALEQAALTASVPAPAAATAAAPSTGAADDDCLPSGMRLLVAMGDKYAVCGQPASIEVTVIDNGYMTLADGTTVPSGGTAPLRGTPCTLGVTSGGDEGLTGYAEIRVTC